jgi:hypothetical protein
MAENDWPRQLCDDIQTDVADHRDMRPAHQLT